VSVYLPSGLFERGTAAAKFRFLAEFMPYCARLKRRRRDYVLCGDWNIAHKEIDLRNWRSNQKNSGFLPEERAWLDELFGEVRYVDGFPQVNPAPRAVHVVVDRGQAWAKNVGWRIDYQVLSPGLRGSVEVGGHLTRRSASRPRAAHARLRPVSAGEYARRSGSRARDGRPAQAVVARLARSRGGLQAPRVLAMLFLGFSAGLPFMLVFSTLLRVAARGRRRGATIGMLSWVGIIYRSSSSGRRSWTGCAFAAAAPAARAAGSWMAARAGGHSRIGCSTWRT